MSEQNHEQRIADLEKLVFAMADTIKKGAANDAALFERIIEVRALNLLTLRLILGAGLVKNDTILQPLQDVIARAETSDDQITARVMEIQARLDRLPPSAPLGS
jgi:hypothetical protein